MQGNSWVKQPTPSGLVSGIAVSPEGIPWIFDTAGDVYFWGGAGFLPASTGLGCISSLAVGPTSAPFSGVFGDVWIVKDCRLTTASGNIYQFQFGLSWVQIPGGAVRISVSPDLGVPWIVNGSGQIFE